MPYSCKDSWNVPPSLCLVHHSHRLKEADSGMLSSSIIGRPLLRAVLSPLKRLKSHFSIWLALAYPTIE